jgi:hypothetical protein
MPLAMTKIMKSQAELKKKYKEAMTLISGLKSRSHKDNSHYPSAYPVATPSPTSQASKPACWNCKAYGIEAAHHYLKCPFKE